MYYSRDDSIISAILAGNETYDGRPLKEAIRSELALFGKKVGEDSFTFSPDLCYNVIRNCVDEYYIDPDVISTDYDECQLFGIDCKLGPNNRAVQCPELYDACANCRTYPPRPCSCDDYDFSSPKSKKSNSHTRYVRK